MTALAALLIGVCANSISMHLGAAATDPYLSNVVFSTEFVAPTDKSASGITNRMRGPFRYSTTVKFGLAALENPTAGSIASILIPKANFTFGSADWTYECWFASPETPASTAYFMSYWDNNSDAGPVRLGFNPANSRVIVGINSAVSNCYFSLLGSPMNVGYLFDGKFHHIALQRRGTVIEVYIDGVLGSGVHQIGTTALSDPSLARGTNIVGGTGTNGFSNLSIKGIFDSVRLTRNNARYSGSFDVPTAAFPVGASDPLWSDVVALYDFEEAGIRFGMWTAGTAALTQGIIVANNDIMLTSASGLTTDANPHLVYYALGDTGMDLGSGDFTIELWDVTLSTTTLAKSAFGQWYPTDGERGWYVGTDTTGNPKFFWTVDGITSNALQFSASTLTQRDLAITRSGTTLRLYMDGTLVATGAISGAVFFPASTPLAFMRMVSSALATTGGNAATTVRAARVTKGIARYTGAGYTVPTLPFSEPITGSPTVPADPIQTPPKMNRQRLYAVVGENVGNTDLRVERQRLYAVVEP